MKINFFVPALLLAQFFILPYGCDARKPGHQSITYHRAYDIPVEQPSGLDLTFRNDGFWTVSDENSTVYKLDKWARKVKSFKISGNDLEGITVLDEERLAVVLERSREVVIIDTSGKELFRRSLNIKGHDNSGLEGIAYDTVGKKFFILNEKNPCLLIILDKNLNLIKQDTLGFIKDASGIYFDAEEKELWILSDESKLVCKCDLSGKLLQEYRISVAQPEGIVLDKQNKNLFIVSDRNNALYVYKLQ